MSYRFVPISSKKGVLFLDTRYNLSHDHYMTIFGDRYLRISQNHA